MFDSGKFKGWIGLVYRLAIVPSFSFTFIILVLPNTSNAWDTRVMLLRNLQSGIMYSELREPKHQNVKIGFIVSNALIEMLLV